jgi:hypothetical protein
MTVMGSDAGPRTQEGFELITSGQVGAFYMQRIRQSREHDEALVGTTPHSCYPGGKGMGTLRMPGIYFVRFIQFL